MTSMGIFCRKLPNVRACLRGETKTHEIRFSPLASWITASHTAQSRVSCASQQRCLRAALPPCRHAITSQRDQSARPLRSIARLCAQRKRKPAPVAMVRAAAAACSSSRTAAAIRGHSML